jgi:hypothetical protein
MITSHEMAAVMADKWRSRMGRSAISTLRVVGNGGNVTAHGRNGGRNGGGIGGNSGSCLATYQSVGVRS